ncbi:HigA family addiction module antidote protein [Burkholderia cenocepacia]|uniref:Putative virulence-associated porotein n=1 Tax=Burkholderia gladioli (strain BSR3) TaxID=999541 RepID=F2LSH8_BURGS|nr:MULTISPECIES: HigA family addiction module antitoxin [Burkholderia]AEA65774.1 putative virulence-associated porotein [Burkholderia gladioli BSR3]MBR8043119.1 HigA family addiction module antidote protein [Burkholderia cenocepacia]MBR8324511.1 HigA family addiction module antidote protein [Burkholderia cenocepacia]
MSIRHPSPPSHPGDILRDRYLQPRGLPPRALARALHISSSRMHRLIHGELGITADLAVRLGLYFNEHPMVWMIRQAKYDVAELLHRDGKRLAGMVQPPQSDEEG